MRYRSIPDTFLKVSEVGFSLVGLKAFARSFGKSSANHLLRYALDRGINFFEATDQDDGQTETWLGAALIEERDRVILATQWSEWAEMEDQHSGPDLRRLWVKSLRDACHQSLKRLQTERLDFYQIHCPSQVLIEHEEVFAALEKLKREGKLLIWGAVLEPGPGMLEQGKLLMRFRKARCLNIIYNPLEQEPAESLIGTSTPTHTFFFVRFSPASALLDERPGTAWIQENRGLYSQTIDKIQKMKFLNQGKDRTLGQAALKFALSKSEVVSVFPLVRTEEDINLFSRTSESQDLTADEIKSLRKLDGEEQKERTFSSLPSARSQAQKPEGFAS